MTNWTQPIDIYCERMGAGFWAEPINALTNSAFFVAALLVWRLQSKLSTVFAVLIVLIGLGSFAFHTWANRMTAVMDIAAIGLYLIAFAYCISNQWNRHSRFISSASILFLFVCITLSSLIVNNMKMSFTWLPSGLYLGAWLALTAYAGITQKENPNAARWLWIAVVIFPCSLLLRQLDNAWCDATGGTHWLWHVLNAVVLWSSTRGLCQKRLIKKI
jgi:hypothetical protein